MNKKRVKEMEENIFGVMALLFLLFLAGLAGHFENTYTMEGEVYKCKVNIVTFVDKADELWEWETEANESFEVGDKVKLYFDTHTTDRTRKDDELYKIKKIAE